MARKDFDGQIVVVTGASTGLGRAISVEVASRGAKAVIINYARSEAEALETAGLVRQEGDVSSDDDCRRIAAAAEPYGRVDVLFNNAGMTKMALDHSDLDSVNAEDFQRLYAVNVIGSFQMIRACKELLQKGPNAGAVVMTASIAGVAGMGSSVPYCASKGAMITMTIDLARALAPKIRVNALCPGDTAPGMLTTTTGRRAPGTSDGWLPPPLGQIVEADDVAAAAAFLLSGEARRISGVGLLIDAGMRSSSTGFTAAQEASS